MFERKKNREKNQKKNKFEIRYLGQFQPQDLLPIYLSQLRKKITGENIKKNRICFYFSVVFWIYL